MSKEQEQRGITRRKFLNDIFVVGTVFLLKGSAPSLGESSAEVSTEPLNTTPASVAPLGGPKFPMNHLVIAHHNLEGSCKEVLMPAIVGTTEAEPTINFQKGETQTELEQILTGRDRELFYVAEDHTETPLAFAFFVDGGTIQIRGVLVGKPKYNKEERATVLQIVTFITPEDSYNKRPVTLKVYVGDNTGSAPATDFAGNLQAQGVLMQTIEEGRVSGEGGNSSTIGSARDLINFLQPNHEIIFVTYSQSSGNLEFDNNLATISLASQHDKRSALVLDTKRDQPIELAFKWGVSVAQRDLR